MGASLKNGCGPGATNHHPQNPRAPAFAEVPVPAGVILMGLAKPMPAALGQEGWAYLLDRKQVPSSGIAFQVGTGC